MSWLDKVAKKTLDALELAVRAAEQVQVHVAPLIERSPLASRLRVRFGAPEGDEARAPDNAPATEEPSGGPTRVGPLPPVERTATTEKPERPIGKPLLAAQVFGRGTDPWTLRALQLFEERGIECELVDLEAEGGESFEVRLVRETHHPSSPFIYLRGDYVGGFNALNELDRLGQLDELVKTPEERAAAGGRRRIVVPKRSGDDLAPGERGNPDSR